MTEPAPVSEFTLLVVTRDAVWLLPAGAKKRRGRRTSWELLEDLADESLPVNRSRPEQAAVYKRLLSEARRCPCAPPNQRRRA